MNLNLQDKNAFVCGSTQGIGLASAKTLAKMGANITLIARNETKLQAALLELDNSLNQQHDYLIADFSKPEQLREITADYIKSSQKNIHILINNTGGPKGGAITEADAMEFVRAYEMHIVCNHYLAQNVLDGMKNDRFGRIINIISTSVKIPINGLGVSNTTRGAVASWAKTWSNEVAKFGITVNNVLPGFTDTVRLKQLFEAKATRLNTNYETILQNAINTVPANRLATAQEVANVVGFLCSEAAAMVNGTSIPVDGGRTGCI